MAGERVEGVGVVQLEQVANVQEGQKETKSLNRKRKTSQTCFPTGEWKKCIFPPFKEIMTYRQTNRLAD